MKALIFILILFLIFILFFLNYLNYFENEGFKDCESDDDDECDPTSTKMCNFKLTDGDKNKIEINDTEFIDKEIKKKEKK